MKKRPNFRPSFRSCMSQSMLRLILFYGAFQASFGCDALARVYDWVSITQDDLQVITDPELEFKLRFELIQRAEHELDLATFDQRPDPQIGMPLLDALEAAAQRGVKVRFILDGFMLNFKDSKGLVKKKLQNIASHYPNFEYLISGSRKMRSQGWRIIDGIHEKLLIVDQKWAMTGGRGNGAEYLKWLDTGFMIKGALVNQSKVAFDSIWESLNAASSKLGRYVEGTDEFPEDAEIHKIYPPDSDYENYIDPAASRFNFKLSQEESRTWRSWFERRSRGRKYKARVLHFNFIEQMSDLPEIRSGRKFPRDITLDQRVELLDDPVVNEVISSLSGASRLKVTSLSSVFNPKFKAALKERLDQADLNEESFTLELLTNSKESFQTITPLQVPFGWYAGLSDLDDLLYTRIRATAYGLEPKESPRYSHRKLVVIHRDKSQSRLGDLVIFGSHNLTFGSSTRLDELSFEIESDEIAGELSELFDQSVLSYARELDPGLVHREHMTHRFLEWVSRIFKFAY